MCDCYEEEFEELDLETEEKEPVPVAQTVTLPRTKRR